MVHEVQTKASECLQTIEFPIKPFAHFYAVRNWTGQYTYAAIRPSSPLPGRLEPDHCPWLVADGSADNSEAAWRAWCEVLACGLHNAPSHVTAALPELATHSSERYMFQRLQVVKINFFLLQLRRLSQHAYKVSLNGMLRIPLKADGSLEAIWWVQGSTPHAWYKANYDNFNACHTYETTLSSSRTC